MNIASPASDAVARAYPVLSLQEINAEMDNVTMDISKIPFYLPEDPSNFCDAMNVLFSEFSLSRPTFTAASGVIDKLCDTLEYSDFVEPVTSMGPFQGIHYTDVARLCYFLRTGNRHRHSKKTFQTYDAFSMSR
jgi:hypothetical protein